MSLAVTAPAGAVLPVDPVGGLQKTEGSFMRTARGLDPDRWVQLDKLSGEGYSRRNRVRRLAR